MHHTNIFGVQKSIFIFVIINLIKVTLEEENDRVERSIQTAGYGCDVLKPGLLQESIPGTNLNTGTFYIVRMKGISVNGKSALSYGYVTWSGKRHPTGFEYVFADNHHNMEHYQEGAKWYKDSQWAFLRSRQAGWYHLVNCGYPFLYATWSNMQEEDDGTGAFPMTMDINYPGNHSKVDFLFRPVQMKGEGERVFQLETKSFGSGIVSVSSTKFEGESKYLQIESKSIWKERVGKIGKNEEKLALFVFENSKDEGDDGHVKYTFYNGGDGNGDTCSCRQRIMFTVVITFWAWITVYLCWSRKSMLIQIN